MVKFIAALGLLGSIAKAEYSLGLVMPDVLPPTTHINTTRSARNMPFSYDPRTNGADAHSNCHETISTVTRQGTCGNCWAFAASYMLTDSLCRASGVDKGRQGFLAQQYLGSCSQPDKDMCRGGWPSTATNWVMANPSGCVTEACQPYEGEENCEKTFALTRVETMNM